MPQPPRRKRLQMHLSTAVVMMIAAGALIWANCSFSVRHNPRYSQQDYVYYSRLYGWPFMAARDGEMEYPERKHFPLQFAYLRVLLDVTIAVAILFAVWFVCEWWIRRRAARKGM